MEVISIPTHLIAKVRNGYRVLLSWALINASLQFLAHNCGMVAGKMAFVK